MHCKESTVVVDSDFKVSMKGLITRSLAGKGLIEFNSRGLYFKVSIYDSTVKQFDLLEASKGKVSTARVDSK